MLVSLMIDDVSTVWEPRDVTRQRIMDVLRVDDVPVREKPKGTTPAFARPSRDRIEASQRQRQQQKEAEARAIAEKGGRRANRR